MKSEMIQEALSFHQIIKEHLENNRSRTQSLSHLISCLVDIFNETGTKLASTYRIYFRSVKADKDETDWMTQLSRVLCEEMHNLSAKMQSAAQRIQSEALDPLRELTQSCTEYLDAITVDSKTALNEIEANISVLTELNKSMARGAQDPSLSITEKMEISEIYESEIVTCHSRWEEIRLRYSTIVNQLESHNRTRQSLSANILSITKQLVSEMSCKCQKQNNNRTASMGEIRSDEGTHLLTMQIQDKLRAKVMQLHLLGVQTAPETTIQRSLPLASTNMVDDFAMAFTSRSSLKEISESHESTRNLLLDSHPSLASYFLSRLKDSIFTDTHLSEVKYHELTAILKYFFASLCEKQILDLKQLHLIMYISFRIRHGNRFLIGQLGANPFWRNHRMWLQLGKQIQKLGNKIRPRIPSINEIKSRKNIWDEGQADEQLGYNVVWELNYYMHRLKLNDELILSLLRALRESFELSQVQFAKLCNYHFIAKVERNNTILKSDRVRASRGGDYKSYSRQESILWSVGMALKYLQLGKQVIKLKQVSSLWHTNLRLKIYERYLLEEQSWSKVSSYRLRIYLQICGDAISQQTFQRMRQQLPDRNQNDQIIKLDVRRSASNEPQLRPALEDILKIFAYFHQQTGYLQGMNYLCESLLRLKGSTYQTYRIFQWILNTYYHGLFGQSLDGLKQKIYQLTRQLHYTAPRLSAHFIKEELEGENFLLGWLITLWGETSGDLKWVLLDGFVLHGHKWWMKTIIWLLLKLEPTFLSMNFEDLMKSFSDLNNSLFAYTADNLRNVDIDANKLKAEIEAIEIEDTFLEAFMDEYQTKASVIKELGKKRLNEMG